MRAIINAFDFLINTIRTLWDFFVSTLQNLLMLFKYLGVVADLSYSAIESMPTWLQTFGVLTIVVSILYMILGRDTGGSKQ